MERLMPMENGIIVLTTTHSTGLVMNARATCSTKVMMPLMSTIFALP